MIRHLKDGSGPTVIVLHHETGSWGVEAWGAPQRDVREWTTFHEKLAQQFTVYAPEMPGWGGSDRLPWARNVRDIAEFMLGYCDEIGVSSAALVGLGFGGWIAAEMAAMSGARFPQLTLAAPMGIRPRQGEIMDQILMSFDDFMTCGFASQESREALIGGESRQEQRREWARSRESMARVAWKPYMWSAGLPNLLPLVKSSTVILHGAEDNVVPQDVSQQFKELMPKAYLEILPGVGHFIDLEAPDKLVAAVADTVKAR